MGHPLAHAAISLIKEIEMENPAGNLCDVNTLVNKLNRLLRRTDKAEAKEIMDTVEAIQQHLTEIKFWAVNKL